ncbi:MAG: sulfatase-like hydrolase/transferase [Candidatus Micrarchaeaceae archaeon]
MRKNYANSMNKNIILLLLDTVRASDAYSSSMPFINGLARHATKYGTAIAPGTWTAPSHASLFTNKGVFSLSGVSKNFFRKNTKIEPWFVKTKFLSENERTIASALYSMGYYSVLFSNNPFLTSFTNLAVGFDKVYDIWLHSNIKYNKALADKVSFVLKGGVKTRERIFSLSDAIAHLIPKPFFDKVYLNLRLKLDESVAKADGTYKLDRGASDTIAELENYMEHSYNFMPHFIFMNFMEAHENYPVSSRAGLVQDKWLYMSGIEELDDYAVSKLHGAYLRRLRYLDAKLKQTIAALRSHGMLENATVVITSDHGQLFGEHGMLYHSLFPYKEEVEVPLVGANFEGGKLVKSEDFVEKPVSTISLYDAVLNLASGREEQLNGNLRRGRYVVSEHAGISEGWDYTLLSMLKGRSTMARLIYNAKMKNNIRSVAIYGSREKMKLIHFFGKRKDELYSLNDHYESENLIDAKKDVALKLLKAYAGLRPRAEPRNA